MSQEIKTKLKNFLHKSKIIFIDYFHLVFKPAADNHLRIQQCQADKSGKIVCSVSFSSYSDLKKFQKKLRQYTVGLGSAVAMVVVALLVSPLIFNPSGSQASNFQWAQTDWSGEVSGEDATKNGWTSYESIDSGLVAGTDVTLKTPTPVSTGDASGYASAAAGTGTAAGTYNSTTIYKASSTLSLKKNETASCSTDGECLLGLCPSASNTCGKIADGATCIATEESDCTSGVCPSNTLTCGKIVDGGSCDGTNSDCQSGACLGGTCLAACSSRTACGTACSYGGGVYNSVTIGTQCWFKENLNVGTKLAGGLPSDPFDYNNIEKLCYGNNDTNNGSGGCNTGTATGGGGLYSWAEANGLASSCNAGSCSVSSPNRGICPSGWHIPTDSELTSLTNYLSANSSYWCGGASANIAKALAKTSSWNSSATACAVGNNQAINDTSGFSLLAGGYRNTSGSYLGYGQSARIWSATQYSTASYAYYRSLSYAQATVTSTAVVKTLVNFVRCLKD